MVLNELSSSLTSSFSAFFAKSNIDTEALDALLTSICTALLTADVNVKLVAKLKNDARSECIRQIEKHKDNAKDIVQKAIVKQLVNMVDPGTPEYKPERGKSQVIMLVGLQGAGKTTTATKLAVHYKKRGFKTCLICADTYRAGAFDQLKQNATKASIPFYGSYVETDPAKIAAAGVEQFKKAGFDVILLDTSGRHKQAEELWDEMRSIQQAVTPDWNMLIMDGSIGQSAHSQAAAFQSVAKVGSIVITKMDGGAKGGGALSAVAATRSPISFLGMGEHLNDLEVFRPSMFIQKLIGMRGGMEELMHSIEDAGVMEPDKQTAMIKIMEEGRMSIRDWREQISNIMSLGPMSQLANMIPGIPAGMIDDEQGGNKMKKMIFITDSMTAEELDSDGRLFVIYNKKGEAKRLSSRARRIARGSGTSLRDVEDLLMQYRMMGKMAATMGGKGSMMSVAQKMAQFGPTIGLKPGVQPTPSQMSQIRKHFTPEELKQLQSGGSGPQAALQQMMAGLGGGNGGGMPDLGALMSQMGLGGAGGGMPDMSKMSSLLGGMFGGGAAR